MIKKKNKKTVITFYKFVKIKEIKLIKDELILLCKQKKLFGTILIAEEGINGTISGNSISVKILKDYILKKINNNIDFKESYYNLNPFLRLKVKIKKEIIKLGVKNIQPEFITGKYVKPENWNKFVNDRNVIILDARNNYETEIGSFKNSLITKTKNFSEFPKWLKKNKTAISQKKIAMFCTGGIRCEKACSFLIKNGFDEVYQLEGGILNYFKKINLNKSIWSGECFVFDDRVSLNQHLEKGSYIQCFACKSAIEKSDTFSQHYVKGISCHKCFNATSVERKKNLKEREKQIRLSYSKGKKHIGCKE